MSLLWLVLLFTVAPVHALSWLSELQMQATVQRASVAACPKEVAKGLTLGLNDTNVTGHLRQLSLDLTCSQSLTSQNGAASPASSTASDEALSLLLSLPKVNFTIDTLTLHLSQGVISGPAELHHDKQQFRVIWQTGSGPTQLSIIPEQLGWRWQGEVPGSLLNPSLHQPVTLTGSWQPEQPLKARLTGVLAPPLSGSWQLALHAKQQQGQWSLSDHSQLIVDNFAWHHLKLKRLKLKPEGGQTLNKPWRFNLSWQQGVWQQQPLPNAKLQLSVQPGSSLQGSAQLRLAPELKLLANWHYDQQLMLSLPSQSVSVVQLWSWLDTWLLLPVEVAATEGRLQLSLSASNVLDNKAPIRLNAELTAGQFAYRDIVAEQVAAKLNLEWAQQKLRTIGAQGVSIATLNLGVPITQIQGAWQWRKQQPWLLGITGHALGGQLALSPMAITGHPRGEIHASNISLEKVLHYASIEGLTGSGQLHARLPFTYQGGISVANGRASSKAGWISYQANSQLEESGEANLSLGLTLSLLSDLRYDKLNSTISMAPTGEAEIAARLQGQAPIMGKVYPVNLNYHHQENLLQLLASLRFAQDLSEQLPASLQGKSE